MTGTMYINGKKFEIEVTQFDISRNEYPNVGIVVVSNIKEFEKLAINYLNSIRLQGT